MRVFNSLCQDLASYFVLYRSDFYWAICFAFAIACLNLWKFGGFGIVSTYFSISCLLVTNENEPLLRASNTSLA